LKSDLIFLTINARVRCHIRILYKSHYDKVENGCRGGSLKKPDLGGTVGFGKRPAIIVVDFQKGLTLADTAAGIDMPETVEIEDGVADRSIDTHSMFLWNMGQKYADIMTASIGKRKPLVQI
jgi:hypothetical protein